MLFSKCKAAYKTFKTVGRARWGSLVTPQVRNLHLAPPFLVEDYTPAAVTTYRLGRMPEKLASAQSELSDCKACPRNCGVNR